jgi:IS4 transposase
MGLFKRNKNNHRPLLRQIIDLIPAHILAGCIQRHKSDKHCSRYRTRDQLVAQMFGQLNKCYTLEDISAGIAVNKTYIADLGLSQSPARSTMSDGNAKRSWQVFEALYVKLLRYYEGVLKAKHQSTVIEEVKHKTIKLVDSTTISLCLSLFSWAKFRTAKGGLKIHTCWDDSLALPEIINITEAKTHDVPGHPQRIYAKGTIVVEDRGYFDFALMAARCAADNHFVTRIKDNTIYEVLSERPLPEGDDQHILVDEEIMLTSSKAIERGMGDYALRRIAVYDAHKDRTLEILTNNFEWKASTIAALYKKRWDIELFFKAIKQNLQIKTFVGTSENAVRSQIFIALICYLLLELLRRNTCRGHHAFSNFCERIRICLSYYISLDYVCNNISQGAKLVAQAAKVPDIFSGQTTIH